MNYFSQQYKRISSPGFYFKGKVQFIGSRIAVLYPLAWEQNVGLGLALLKSWKKSAKYGYALLIQKRYHTIFSLL